MIKHVIKSGFCKSDLRIGKMLFVVTKLLSLIWRNCKGIDKAIFLFLICQLDKNLGRNTSQKLVDVVGKPKALKSSH